MNLTPLPNISRIGKATDRWLRRSPSARTPLPRCAAPFPCLSWRGLWTTGWQQGLRWGAVFSGTNYCASRKSIARIDAHAPAPSCKTLPRDSGPVETATVQRQLLFPSVQLDGPHQNVVGMIEVCKLVLKSVCPFFTVKQVIPEPVYDDQQGRYDLRTIRCLVS